jgi:type IV pilus assembly protein PilA
VLKWIGKRYMRMHEIRHQEGGFTLIELLVVIIIIGLLAAIAIPLYLAQRGRAHEAAVESDARNAGSAYTSCFTDLEDGDLCNTDAELDAYGFNTTLNVTMAYDVTDEEAPVITATWTEGGATAPVATFDGGTGRTTLTTPAP